MKITEVVVSAGRVIPHPSESYSNLRPQLTLKATLDEGEDCEAVTKELQAKAEKLIEDHKNHLVNTIEDLQRMAQRDAEIADLERRIKQAQDRVADLRKPRVLPAPELPPVTRTVTDYEESEMPF